MAKATTGEDTLRRDALFIRADSFDHAMALMVKKFPDEVGAGFTVQLWSLHSPRDGWFFANGVNYRSHENLRNGNCGKRTEVRVYRNGHHTDTLLWKEPNNAAAA